MCGFYLNELLLRLLPRDDPHEALFDSYGEALTRLSTAGDASVVLRGFEKRLLAELGDAPILDRDAASRPIDPDRLYAYEPERGPTAVNGTRGDLARARTGPRQRGGEPPNRSVSPLRLRAGARPHGGERHARRPAGRAGPDPARRGRRRLHQPPDARRGEAAHARVDRRAPARAGTAYTHRPEGVERLVIELGVNVDHVATVRQARRTYEPDPVWAAVEAHLGGADGITVHLREDRRHIQDEDVRRLRELVHIKLNLETAATKEMIDIACRIKPEMAMLVPEGRHEITTEGGLDVAGQEPVLGDVVQRLT